MAVGVVRSRPITLAFKMGTGTLSGLLGDRAGLGHMGEQ